jgi:hypothetical protein
MKISFSTGGGPGFSWYIIYWTFAESHAGAQNYVCHIDNNIAPNGKEVNFWPKPDSAS